MYVNGIVIKKYAGNSYKGIDGSGFSENTGLNWYFNYDEQLSDLFESFYDEHIGMTYWNLKEHSWVAACNNMDYIISYIAESKKEVYSIDCCYVNQKFRTQFLMPQNLKLSF